MTDRTKLEGVKAYKKFAVELNKEMRTRKTEVIGAFRALNRLGAGSTMYPPSFRAPSPMQIGGQVQGWALESVIIILKTDKFYLWQHVHS